MTDKHILVNPELHNQVKAAAALEGKSIKEWAETHLAAALPREPLLPFGGDDDDNGNARKDTE